MIRLFRVVLPASILTLFLSEALLLIASYGVPAYFDRKQQDWPPVAIMAALILAAMYLTRMYSDLRNAGIIRLMQSLAFVMGSALLAQAVFTYMKLDWALPQRIVIRGSVLRS